MSDLYERIQSQVYFTFSGSARALKYGQQWGGSLMGPPM